ncbi:MAG: hypothetical protein QOE35_2176 [Actinomycetota bacterium]
MTEHGAVSAVVLVEGVSDQRALEALARRRGRDLAREGVAVVAIGGAKNVRAFLEHYGPYGLGLTITGMCDAGEAGDFARAAGLAGVGQSRDAADLDALGFSVCVADLEDELIRSLGPARVEQVIETQGEMGSFRTFQKQASQRERSVEQQLRRFMGTKGGRKVRYSPLLVDALDLTNVPRPLERVLARV